MISILDKQPYIPDKQLLETVKNENVIVKIGWCSNMSYLPDILKQKIDILQKYGYRIYFGGTLFELCYCNNNLDYLYNEMNKYNLNIIEISNGCFNISLEDKTKIIKECKKRGYTVISEVGKKLVSEDNLISITERANCIIEEFKAGSDYVVIEGIESSTVGIFNEQCKLKNDFIELLKNNNIDFSKIIFEATQKSNQVDLINIFGNYINFGNISWDDLFPLITLKKYHRGDTIRMLMPQYKKIRIDNGIAGAKRCLSRKDKTIIVVDIIKSSNTIATLLKNNNKIYLNNNKNYIHIGKNLCNKLPPAPYNNSPSNVSKLYNKSIYFNTTNFTKVMENFNNIDDINIYVAGYFNIDQIHKLIHQNENITILMCGHLNNFIEEDISYTYDLIKNLNNTLFLGLYKFIEFKNYNLESIVKDRDICHEDITICQKKDWFNNLIMYKKNTFIVEKEKM